MNIMNRPLWSNCKSTTSEIGKAFKPSVIYGDLISLQTNQYMFLFAMLGTMLSLSYVWQDSMLSIISGVTGVLCVFLVNMRKLSNYFWGAINVLLYGYIAYNTKYYGDTMLNWAFYFPIQFIGAYYWAKSMDGGEVISRKITSVKTLLTLVLGSFTTVILYSMFLSAIGGSLSLVDSTSTTLSILATYFMVKGYREQWICWIIVNVVSIYMWYVNFVTNGDSISVLVMWSMFLANAIYGCYTWFKASKNQVATA